MVNRWFFPLDKKLNHTEWKHIENEIRLALSDWNTHGKRIDFNVHNFFLQVIVIEAISPTSGCSIDTLQKKVRDVLNAHALEVLPSQYVMYLKDNELGYFDFRETESQIQNQTITEETLILDTQKILEGDENPLSILRDTWLVRYC
ncbi:MAG: hypothetical protein KatS3mg035_0366 [Bacteroidia bacterium]|nr:MAG: hypothetical protein KatS3mg035_0366 [Bacteroidia bacterium]